MSDRFLGGRRGFRAGRLAVDGDGYQVWAKALANGTQAALAINLGDVPINVTVALSDLDLAAAAAARDLWAQAPLTNLASHDSAFVRFSPAA